MSSLFFKVKQMTYTGISGLLSDMKAEFLRTLRQKQTQLCDRKDLRGVYTVSYLWTPKLVCSHD